jgi:signal transduction histidine kinase
MKGWERCQLNDEQPVLADTKAAMKPEIEIPHRPVALHNGVLRADTSQESVNALTHELRTPLNVIIGLCQVLERDRNDPLSPTQRDVVDRMEKNAHSLLKSVNGLLQRMRSAKTK